MERQEQLVISALVKALRGEWPEGTHLADMVRYAGVTAEELAAVEEYS